MAAGHPGRLTRRRTPPDEVIALAITAAGGLCVIDSVYAARGRIRGVYLIDAAMELGLIAGWARALRAPRLWQSESDRISRF
jgi:hypothetical protein